MRGSVIRNSGKAHKSQTPMLANLMRRDRMEREFQKAQEEASKQLRMMDESIDQIVEGKTAQHSLGSPVASPAIPVAVISVIVIVSLIWMCW